MRTSDLRAFLMAWVIRIAIHHSYHPLALDEREREPEPDSVMEDIE